MIPEFEKTYKDAGVEVKFGSKSYILDIEQNAILLEDLKPKGFINVNWLEGFVRYGTYTYSTQENNLCIHFIDKWHD